MARVIVGGRLVLGFLFYIWQVSMSAAAFADPTTADLLPPSCLSAPNRACILQQALVATRSIPDDLQRINVLIAIGKAQSDGAVIEEAMGVARSIRLERLRAIAIASVAVAQVELGLFDEASDRFDEALQIARSVLAGIPANVRPSALGAVSHAGARAGRIEEALEIARAIEDPGEHAFTLGVIALTQAIAGVFSRALEIARSIDDVDKRATILRQIAERLARAGRIRDALEIVPDIKDESERGFLLASVAGMQALAGEIAEALQTARSIKHTLIFHRALMTIVKAQAKTGSFDQATATLGLGLN